MPQNGRVIRWQAQSPETSPVLLMCPDRGAEHGRVRLLPEIIHLALQPVRLAPIVGILPSDPSSTRQCESAVERSRQTLVRLRDDPDSRIAVCLPGQESAYLRVAASVVHDQKFEI